ncbi:hypothetical protein SRHO_G00325300 [Serrasalmus rhombeus]
MYVCRDCLQLGGLNSRTSFVTSLTIFSVLGFMAQEQGVAIADVAESGHDHKNMDLQPPGGKPEQRTSFSFKSP